MSWLDNLLNKGAGGEEVRRYGKCQSWEESPEDLRDGLSKLMNYVFNSPVGNGVGVRQVGESIKFTMAHIEVGELDASGEPIEGVSHQAGTYEVTVRRVA